MTSVMFDDEIPVNLTAHVGFGIDKHSTASEPAMLYLDIICNLWFTFELGARFIFSPGKMVFLKDPLNMFEMVATISSYIDFVYYMIGGQNNDYVQFIGLARIMRLFRLAKHNSGLKLLAQTFKASAHELVLLVFVVLLGIILFGALIFYAERSQGNPDNNFDSVRDNTLSVTREKV